MLAKWREQLPRDIGERTPEWVDRVPLTRRSGTQSAGLRILSGRACLVAQCQPHPHPEPERELDCGVMSPGGGVIKTFWKVPFRGFETTTNAGDLLVVPVAQLG